MLTSVKGTVLTAGALAVAISAIIALVPRGSAPPSTVAASFVPPIQVYADTTLEEYAARVKNSGAAAVTTLGGGQVASYRLAADTTPVVTTSDSTTTTESLGSGSPTSESTTTSSVTSSTETATLLSSSSSTFCILRPSSSSETSSSTPSGTACASSSAPVTPAPTAGALHVLGSVANVQNVAQRVGSIPVCPGASLTASGTCTTNLLDRIDMGPCPTGVSAGTCGAAPEIARAMSGGVEPAAAARRVAALFRASRAVEVGGAVHPLGVMVTFGAELVGFDGTPATIRWSLYSADSAERLPREWFQSVSVLRITPNSNDDRFASQFWVPEPRARGHYFVELEAVGADGVVRAFARSQLFR